MRLASSHRRRPVTHSLKSMGGGIDVASCEQISPDKDGKVAVPLKVNEKTEVGG